MPQPAGRFSATETGSGVRCGSVRKRAGGNQDGKCRRERLAAEISLRLGSSWGFCAIKMTDTDFPGIAKRRAEILGDLAAIAETPPMLVAVTKTQSDAALEEILAAGHRVFGENRVQEAFQHWETRRADYPDLELRLIGPLQSNKSEDAVNLFHVIETLDRPKLCRQLAKAEQKSGLKRTYLIQVNTGEEPQKAGVAPRDVEALLRVAREQGLDVTGLMCIPPVDEPAGPHFALLAKIAKRLELPQLSMGMSADYDIATRFGATHVRVGSALFGPRASSA